MKDIIINTTYPPYGYLDTELYFNLLKKHNNNYVACLDELLNELDCTRLNKKGQQLISTEHYSYENTIYLYIRILLRIKNEITYNAYYDILLKRHNANLEFESEYKTPVISKTKKAKTDKPKKIKVENKFIRKVTIDLFTDKEVYIYFNPKTGEEIESDNPNLLDELNERLKRKSKVKSNNYIKPEHLHFNFNKHE